MTAPSTFASAATIMMKTKGVHCQTSAMTMAMKASVGSASQPIGATPNMPSNALSRPNCASKM